MKPWTPRTALGMLLLAGCGGNVEPAPRADAPAAPAAPPSAATRAAMPPCDADNGGLTLPPGFCALVVVDDVAPGRERARHIAVAPNGDLYVALQGARGAETPAERGAIVALRDTNGDGKADQRERFGTEGGTGLELRDGYLYYATNSAVLRYRLGSGLGAAGAPDTLVHQLPDDHSHTAKSIALGPGDALFVNIGSPTNACQPLGQDRQAGVKGVDPCTQLDTRAGIWRFSAQRMRQTQAQGVRYATGIRNAVALDFNTADNALYTVQHGRDQLDLWPGFTQEQNALRVAEELQRVTPGSDFGWPYCYYDTDLRRRVLAPEYGGDGREVGRCAGKADPVVAFPGHWAPNDLLFYTGTHLPAEYRNGAFIAFHGSWNRAPLPQAGYKVAFVPFRDGRAVQDYRIFADGFTGDNPQPNSAEHRPMGLAQGPDGSLYIADSSGGTIWRVIYRG